MAIGGGARRAVLITEDNGYGGWRRLEDAIASGRAFAVQVAPDILALDSDLPGAGDILRDVTDRCTALGSPPVLVASGQPGRHHLFARIAERQAYEEAAAFARAHGIHVPWAIRPPFAPHRLGLEPHLVDPTDPELALAHLTRERDLPRHGLSCEMSQLLRFGDTRGRYDSRSEVIQALTQAAVNAGWSFDEIYETLLDPRNVGGERLQEEFKNGGDAGARKYLAQSFRKARRLAATRPAIRSSVDALRQLEVVQAALDVGEWHGRAGATDHAVLKAHLLIARSLGRLEYGASVRQIAEAAALSTRTVCASHRRLVVPGWLCVIELGRAGRATIWRIRPLPGDASSPISTSGGREESVEVAYESMDVFRWGGGGLGKTAGRTWSVLHPARPRAIGELSQQLHWSNAKLRRQLKRLEQHGLAVQDPAGWRQGDCDLDELAQKLGVAGRGQRDREQHQEERERYREWRERGGGARAKRS